jgi:hypothetical protein
MTLITGLPTLSASKSGAFAFWLFGANLENAQIGGGVA